MAEGEPQAKGVWFVTARRQLVALHGEAAAQRVARRMGPRYGSILLEPVVSDWYPEVAFQRAMGAVFDEVCGGDAERFVAFIEASTELGIHRFLRVILALSSPRFLLSKMPVLWSRHRLHNGTLAVEVGERSARLRYAGFPFFDDRNYRLFVRGVLRKTVEVSSGVVPEVVVRDYGRDHLDVQVEFGPPRR